MTNDRHRAAAREWLESGHHEAVRFAYREEFTDHLAALLARVEAEAVERDRDAAARVYACVCQDYGMPEGKPEGIREGATLHEALSATFDHVAEELTSQLADAKQETSEAEFKWNASADALVLATKQLADAQVQVATLRAALEWVIRYEGGLATVGPYPPVFKNCATVLADTAAAAQAHDERIRAEERERCAKALIAMRLPPKPMALLLNDAAGQAMAATKDACVNTLRALSPMRPVPEEHRP